MTPLRQVKVVCLGGGSGLSTLLAGVKRLARGGEGTNRAVALENLTAIVTVTDDGGSSGRIRDQFQTPAPGDIRNCLTALASDESLMTDLFRYRFRGTGDLKNHSLGNLFLTALADLTGDFLTAVRLSSRILAVEGRILPSTLENTTLRAELEDGRIVSGETAVTRAPARIERVYLEPECRALPEALEAIDEADIVTLGPGSLFTSLLPNLALPETLEALRSSGAFKLLISNIMTQPAETAGLTLGGHLAALRRHCGGEALFGDVLVNSTPIPPALLRRYRKAGADEIKLDLDEARRLGFRVHLRPLLMDGDTARHCPEALAKATFALYQERRIPA